MERIVYSHLSNDIWEENRSIRLRLIQDTDTDIIVCWRNSEAVKSHFIFRDTLTRETHNKWLHEKVYNGDVIQYIIEDENDPIGTVYIRDIDLKNESGEFGIYIGDPTKLSKGIGTKVAKLMVSYCFELGFHRIFLRVLDENTAACRSYLKAGFQQEGIARDMVCIDGKRHNVIFMSVINR